MHSIDTVLVTGGTGRLGGEVVRLIAPAAKTVRLIAMPNDPRAAQVSDVPNVELIEADLTDSSGTLGGAAEGVDVVLHLAAVLPGPGVRSDDVFHGTVSATHNLTSAVATMSPAARFVFVSSTAVYGPQIPSVMDPITEDHPIRPTSVYGAAKAAAEVLVESFGRSHGLRWTVVRPTDIVTRGDLIARRGIVGSRFSFGDAIIRVPIEPSTGRSSELSAASAESVATGIVSLAGLDAAVGKAFHLGSIETPCDEEIARAVAATCGWACETIESEEPVRRWVIDASRVERELGLSRGASILDLLAPEEG